MEREPTRTDTDGHGQARTSMGRHGEIGQARTNTDRHRQMVGMGE